MSTESPSAATAGAASGTTASDNRTLIITLTSVLTGLGLIFLIGAIYIYCRYRRNRRLRLFDRGITPIDDDEIETWKMPRGSEKDGVRPSFEKTNSWTGGDKYTARPGSANHNKKLSTGSATKIPASVIVYEGPALPPAAFSPSGIPRTSSDSYYQNTRARSYTAGSAGRTSFGQGRPSLDRGLPQTPTQARAPNSRVGLTDATVPGDPSFLPAVKRTHSRLSKLPPSIGSLRSGGGPGQGGLHHTRNHSSRSSNVSLRSFIYTGSGSELELQLQLSPRESSDWYVANTGNSFPTTTTTTQAGSSTSGNRSRVYSSSSVPPRLSFGDDIVGGLSPRPLFRTDIGRAIG